MSREQIFLINILLLCSHETIITPHFTQRVDPTAGCCDVSFTPLKVLKVLKGLKPKKTHPGPMVSQMYCLKS